jgi:hypothetical protein
MPHTVWIVILDTLGLLDGDNMKKTSTKKTVTETIVDQYKITDKVKMRVVTINGKLTSANFYSKGNKKEFSCVPDHKKFRDQVKEYNPFYYDHPKHKALDTITLILESAEELFKLAEDDKLTDENFFYVDGSCHRVEDVNGDYIDIMVLIDYIGGFSQKSPDCDYKLDWDWDKLKKRLAKCKDVISFEENLIPYYNSDFHGQMALSCNVIMRKGWVPRDKYHSNDEIILNMTTDYLGVKGCIK